jgi:hypothetical protein
VASIAAKDETASTGSSIIVRNKGALRIAAAIIAAAQKRELMIFILLSCFFMGILRLD